MSSTFNSLSFQDCPLSYLVTFFLGSFFTVPKPRSARCAELKEDTELDMLSVQLSVDLLMKLQFRKPQFLAGQFFSKKGRG